MLMNTWMRRGLAIMVVFGCLLGGAIAGGIVLDTAAASGDADNVSAEEPGAGMNTTALVTVEQSEPDIETTASDEIVETLQQDANTTQQNITQFANTTDGIEIQERFWIRSAVSVAFNSSLVSVDEIYEVAHVKDVYTDVQTETTAHSQSVQRSHAHTPPGVASVDTSEQPSVVDATWGVEQIHAPTVWHLFGTRGADIKIGVIDTGVDTDHPDLTLASDGWAEFDETGTDVDSEPYDPNGHGTHVSGTIAGGNASGEYIGVAPDADLFHGKIFNDDGTGSLQQLLAGIEWAVEQELDVVTMSLAIANPEFADVLIAPVQHAEQAGTVPVASVGNVGEGTSASPGNVYDAFAVGATDEQDAVAAFSGGRTIETDTAWEEPPDDWPAEYTVPDVTAPGVQITSADPAGGYTEKNGTSMAAPHVSGALALLQSNTEETLSPAVLRELLSSTAVTPADESETRFGHGRIDAAAALDAHYEDPTAVFNISAVEPADITVEQGTPVTLEATVTNDGVIRGSTSVELRIDGVTKATEDIDVGAGKTVAVVFADVDTTDLAPGEYDYSVSTATDTRTGSFVLTAPPHESGVSQPLFDAVDQDGTGVLTRDEIRSIIQQYATDGAVDGVEITRADVRSLIQYYATQ